jgi:MFS transporter, DHA2 family, multidrug resistance protein
MPRRPVDRELLWRTDWGGIVYAGVGFGLIYAGLDHGNRLDWLNSCVVTGLLLGGATAGRHLSGARSAQYPLIHLRVLVQPNVAGPALLISIYGFARTASSFVLPDYLTRVQGLRALQIGDALNCAAAIRAGALLAPLLKRIDARILLAFGFSMLAIAAWLDTGLTHDWVDEDFRASQIAAVCLSFAIAVASITPPQAAAIATTIQIARLLGNEIGSAVIQTFVRVSRSIPT